MGTEDKLLRDARALDKGALAEIYDQYSPGLFRYAVRLLGDSDLAEDCVADTFTRFLGALRRGAGPHSHLQAYLYRVSHNWITDYYRKKQPIILTLQPNHAIGEDIDLSSTLEAKMEKQRVRSALVQLTPDQRQVIILKFLEGWKTREIAESLGKTSGAVKALQHRALMALKRQLVKQEEVT